MRRKTCWSRPIFVLTFTLPVWMLIPNAGAYSYFAFDGMVTQVDVSNTGIFALTVGDSVEGSLTFNPNVLLEPGQNFAAPDVMDYRFDFGGTGLQGPTTGSSLSVNGGAFANSPGGLTLAADSLTALFSSSETITTTITTLASITTTNTLGISPTGDGFFTTTISSGSIPLPENTVNVEVSPTIGTLQDGVIITYTITYEGVNGVTSSQLFTQTISNSELGVADIEDASITQNSAQTEVVTSTVATPGTVSVITSFDPLQATGWILSQNGQFVARGEWGPARLVPEPRSLLLFGSGMIASGLAIRSRRRKQNSV